MNEVAVDRSDSIAIDDLRFVSMIRREEIARAVDRIADEIAATHHGRRPLLLCILSGAAAFHADLMRRLAFPLEADYIRVSSYNGGIRSSSITRITSFPSTQMAGRNVIVVDDVVDTGKTIRAVADHIRRQGAASIETAALLYKPDADVIGIPPDYVGFRIPKTFVVGYGLDYHGLGRNLEHLYMKDEG